MNSRPFDVIIYGATGYTGRLVAAALRTAAAEGPSGCVPLRWAVAGRNPGALSEFSVPSFVANVGDSDSLVRMTSQARMVINCVGPYSRMGEPVVRSCLETKTDYIDITGEPFWISKLNKTFHREAVDRNVLLVPACGFDSIPADVGARVTMESFRRQFPNALGAGSSRPQVFSYMQVKDSQGAPVFSWSDGTLSTWWTSLIDLAESKKAAPPRKHSKSVSNAAATAEKSPTSLWTQIKQTFTAQSPRLHQGSIGCWSIPFAGSDVTAVRLTTDRLGQTGTFAFDQYFACPSWIAAAKAGYGLGIMAAYAQMTATFPVLADSRKELTSSRGSGPSSDHRSASSSKFSFFVSNQSNFPYSSDTHNIDPNFPRLRVDFNLPEIYNATGWLAAHSALSLLKYRDTDNGVLLPDAAANTHMRVPLKSLQGIAGGVYTPGALLTNAGLWEDMQTKWGPFSFSVSSF